MQKFGQIARNVGKKVAAGLGLAAAGVGSAFAAVDNTAILAEVADAQTKGIAVAGAVTVMIFMFAGAKYLRRAK